MGTYIRHIVAGLLGTAVAALVSLMTGWGISVDPDEVVRFTEILTNWVVGGVLVIVYAVCEKFLKRFPWLDIKGYLDRMWLKKEARIASTKPLAEIEREAEAEVQGIAKVPPRRL